MADDAITVTLRISRDELAFVKELDADVYWLLSAKSKSTQAKALHSLRERGWLDEKNQIVT